MAAMVVDSFSEYRSPHRPQWFALPRLGFFQSSKEPNNEEGLAENRAEGLHSNEFLNAPNISLNLHGGNNWWYMAVAAVIGVFLQAGVLVYSYEVTHNPVLKNNVPPRDGSDATTWGFPVLATGTIVLSIALIGLCYIIETSTVEKQWIAGTGDREMPLHIIWLQREQLVGDEMFNSAVFFKTGTRSSVLTSHRSSALIRRVNKDTGVDTELPVLASRLQWLKSKFHEYLDEIITLVCTIFGLLGFIAQFQGFRAVNWTCSLVQLAAVLFMTMIRAILRGGLTARPGVLDRDYSEHEMDRLTHHLAGGIGFLEPRTKGEKSEINCTPKQEKEDQEQNIFWDRGYLDGELRSTSKRGQDIESFNPGEKISDPASEPPSNRVLKQSNRTLGIRRRLGELTKWKASESKYATAVASAIIIVLNKFIDGESFVWVLNNPTKRRAPVFEIILDHASDCSSDSDSGSTHNEKRWKCEGLAFTLESVLSLWLMEIKECDRRAQKDSESMNNGRERKWRLGLGPENTGGQRVKNDIAWWISSQIQLKEQDEIDTYDERVLGYWGSCPYNGSQRRSSQLLE